MSSSCCCVEVDDCDLRRCPSQPHYRHHRPSHIPVHNHPICVNPSPCNDYNLGPDDHVHVHSNVRRSQSSPLVCRSFAPSSCPPPPPPCPSSQPSHTSTSSCLRDDFSVSEKDSRIYQSTVSPPLDPVYLPHDRKVGSTYIHELARCMRTHQLLVIKRVRSNHNCYYNVDHIPHALETTERTSRILAAFHRVIDTKGWLVKINMPYLYDDGKRVLLVERYVNGYRKFNSNAGWMRTSTGTYNQVMQALSHFSYAYSNGEYLLCNLKGGVDWDCKVIVICNPVLASRGKGGVFGCTDNGNRGIRLFFRKHRCNYMCRQLPTPEKRDIFRDFF